MSQIPHSVDDLLNKVMYISKWYSEKDADTTIQTDTLDPILRRTLLRELRASKYQIAEIPECLNNAKFATTVSKTLKDEAIVRIVCVHNNESLPSDVPANLLKQLVRRVCAVMTLCNTSLPLSFYIVPCGETKAFPPPGKLIDATHVNSAYTYQNEHNIYIYRKEEFPKVILHETLHHMNGIDTSKLWSSTTENMVYEMFRIHESTDLRPNEAIVEMWAELFHMAFIAAEYNMSFDAIYDHELRWAMQQAKRILARQGDAKWREDTHAFSYYVIRSILLFSPDEFISILKTAYSPAGITSLIGQLRSVYSSDAYTTAIRSVKIPKNASFRMTIFGDL